MFTPQKIEHKFITGLILAVVLLGGAFSVGSYHHMRSVLEAEVRDKARLIFMHVDSIQNYVRDILRPAMYERLPSSFIIQAMSSSYISRKIMAPVNAPGDGTIYRRVAIGARNPQYEANDYERQLIDEFRRSGQEGFWQGYRTMNGETYYVMARPVRFVAECMYCHGRPEDAPAELLAKYGQKGFGKEPGTIAGVDFVGTSVPKSIGRVRQTILTYFAFFAFAALLLFFTSNFLFRLLVVKNLRRLNAVFRRNVDDGNPSVLLSRLREEERGDEIDQLVGGIEEMGEHLVAARSQLRDYAENLKKMVDERTTALSVEIAARQADVQLFVRLLEDMHRSRTRGQLWRLALPQICRRFGAESISYTCTMGPQSSYLWPENVPSPAPPADFVGMLTGGSCVASGPSVFIPVESSSGSAEGLLCLSWPSSAEAARHDHHILQALGRQLGVAAENLTAIDSLARQMNILETIVEGITDPLALMDANCSVLTSNRAARRLTAELSQGGKTDGNIISPFFDIQAPDCPLRECINRGDADLREVDLPSGRSFALSLYPVPSGSGRTAQIVVYLRETTREKQMLAQIWHAEKMATVGKLTAGLAHEINNPLGVILCYAGLLRQSLSAADQLADLTTIERHTRQAQRVLQDLLNFARPKATETGSADAGAVATSVREVFSAQATKKGASLLLDCPEEPLWVRLGVGEMEQVLSNLVINALDAVPEEGGRIRIQVGQAKGGRVTVEVADNGPGVAAADRPHIFDPFYSTKEIGAGTGLGLTVIYGIVTAAGGRVEIDRAADLGGARFTVSLPAAHFTAVTGAAGDGNTALEMKKEGPARARKEKR